MDIEKNFALKNDLQEENQRLKRELESALLTVKKCEGLISELVLENAQNLKKFTHDISNPLQVLLMSIEALEDQIPNEFKSALERIKRSADAITKIVVEVRKLRESSLGTQKETKII